jgi:hypothetical protein
MQRREYFRNKRVNVIMDIKGWVNAAQNRHQGGL